MDTPKPAFHVQAPKINGHHAPECTCAQCREGSFQSRLKIAVQNHRDRLGSFAAQRSYFRDLTGQAKPDWRAVQESINGMAESVAEIIRSERALEALRAEFVGGGAGPMPTATPEG